ncbi:MAG: DUF4440 domain-containing protein [Actinomycetota bacterium]
MDWRAEIDELHEFFQMYFLGGVDVSALDRVEVALHTDFTFVGPHGDEAERQAVIDRIAAGHGHTSELTISTTEHALVHHGGDVVVARYVEGHHLADGQANRRLSTVVFLVDPDGPNGLRWLRVHETFIESESS